MLKALTGPLIFAVIMCACAFYGAAVIDPSAGPPLDWDNLNQRAAGLLLFGGGGVLGMTIATIGAMLVERAAERE